MDGDPEDEIFSIPPHQLDVVGREADDSIMFLGQLPWELVCSLQNIYTDLPKCFLFGDGLVMSFPPVFVMPG